MIIRKLRQERGWSQEQLSELSGLSVRTIQRIERGHHPSMETLKALAAAFDTDVARLTTRALDAAPASLRSARDDRAIAYVQRVKKFYTQLLTYLVVIGFLTVINLVQTPHHLWVLWPATGWGLAIVLQGLNMYGRLNFFGAAWEKRQIVKHMERNG